MLTTCMDGIVPVAVPPILENITSATSTGLGSRLRTSDSLNVQNEEAHLYILLQMLSYNSRITRLNQVLVLTLLTQEL